MKSQRNQVIALVALLIIWAVSWRLMGPKGASAPAVVAKAAAAKASTQQDNLLHNRFHHIRSEMDALYHFRTKPAPFDTAGNPFHISAAMALAESAGQSRPEAQEKQASVVPGQLAPPVQAAETGSTLLRHAIEAARIGGVVTLGDKTELTVDGQLHKEGDVFTVRVKTKLVLIRIKHLATTSVTLALDDPDAGTAEMHIRLK